MRLSLFTTVTNPDERGDAYGPALACYTDLADEIVIVDGSSGPNKWPKEFSWEFIGQQFQRGYEACDGDWVIRMDIDSIFHEQDFRKIRYALEFYNDCHAVTFFKRQFIVPDRYNVKSRLLLAVNKKRYGDRLRFDGGGDLCQVTVDGNYLEPGHMFVPSVKIPIWNYECLLKTKHQLLEDKGRFARAWHRKFGEYKLGGPDDESAYYEWHKMVAGRFHKPQERIRLQDHPKYIQDTIKNLEPQNWGYNGFGLIRGRVYAPSRIYSR